MSSVPTGLALYSQTADDAAAAVINRYSTSFGIAARLLGARPRPHVRNIYALVRVADEIVDGPAHDAGLTPERERAVLDGLETEVMDAIVTGFSANLVVHAFARTARECGIGADLIAPFFASMRTDLDTAAHDDLSHDAYVYGSAEVVGLMCLQVFLNAGMSAPARPAPDLVDGARRLGAAFQDVNFLRDLADDADRLGRDYLDGAADDERRIAVLDRIDADLAAAAAVIPTLPPDCRAAVITAHDLFAELSRRLRASPAGAPRVRVPDGVKATLAARALLGRPPKGSRS
ncbi:squalene/phytoene synthase family protein [Microbacterium sp. CFBP 8790]|uniref:squalene/phytoene synthase family protein n=1 Tax=Microbacterium sp. CFBP 8790 TaxID=2775271 RepID=UPI00177DA805|nr:squalene/phytoene synthase family protein [Microbacterium sp. CFBP 8790]